jgi:hypothetical protein
MEKDSTDPAELAERIRELAEPIRRAREAEREDLRKRFPSQVFDVAGERLELLAELPRVVGELEALAHQALKYLLPNGETRENGEAGDAHDPPPPTREVATWQVVWRGEARNADAGELVMVEAADGAWWWLLLPEGHGRKARDPRLVPPGFRDSRHAAIVNWHPEIRLGEKGERCTIARCGEGLRALVEKAKTEDKEREYTRARGEYRRAFEAAQQAAGDLVVKLERLCAFEDKRPVEAARTASMSLTRALLMAANDPDPGPEPEPPSRRKKGTWGTLDALRKLAKVIRRFLPAHAPPARRPGNPGDPRIDAAEEPMCAMGLGDDDVARVLRWLDLEKWSEETTVQAALKGRRPGRVYATERRCSPSRRRFSRTRGWPTGPETSTYSKCGRSCATPWRPGTSPPRRLSGSADS